MKLYDTVILVRRGIVLGILGLIALLILLFTFRTIRNIWWNFFPPATPPPTTGFGKLPLLNLPSLNYKGTPVYLLETAAGEIPSFPNRAKVVALKKVKPTLLGERQAKNLAQSFDFWGEGEVRDDKKLITFKDKVDKRTLTVNVVNQNFTLTTNLNHIQRVIRKGSALVESEAIKEAKLTLEQRGLLKWDFDRGRQETHTHRVIGGKVRDAISVSEGQFTRIDFFRSLIDVSAEDTPLLPPNPKIGLIQLWITSGIEPDVNNILYISYNAWEIDKEKVETYPLRSASLAWEEVKQGEGFAEILVEGGSPLDPYTPLPLETVSLRNVDLVYFDDSSWQKYLQPIYVFSGTGNIVKGGKFEFTAYRPAISDDWIQ